MQTKISQCQLNAGVWWFQSVKRPYSYFIQCKCKRGYFNPVYLKYVCLSKTISRAQKTLIVKMKKRSHCKRCAGIKAIVFNMSWQFELTWATANSRNYMPHGHMFCRLIQLDIVVEYECLWASNIKDTSATSSDLIAIQFPFRCNKILILYNHWWKIMQSQMLPATSWLPKISQQSFNFTRSFCWKWKKNMEAFWLP